LQVHGGTEEEGWAVLAEARQLLRNFLAEGLRKRLAQRGEPQQSDEEIREQVDGLYRDNIADKVCLLCWIRLDSCLN
jgi:hypothetical protein